ncbi:hypothetical protein CYK37_14980 [Mesorhizobium loti]|nr:hypothetical protein CYK37_14980 [Mesorhizobium loti]
MHSGPSWQAIWDLDSPGLLLWREQIQQKCAAVLRPELRKSKELERFRGSIMLHNAIWLRIGRLHRFGASFEVRPADFVAMVPTFCGLTPQDEDRCAASAFFCT